MDIAKIIREFQAIFGITATERKWLTDQITAALPPAQEWQDISTAVTAEREACAHIADAIGGKAARAAMELAYGELYGEQCKEEAAEEIANAIRARGMLIADHHANQTGERS